MTTGIGITYTATGEVGEGTAFDNERCLCGHIRAHHAQQCLVEDCNNDCDLSQHELGGQQL